MGQTRATLVGQTEQRGPERRGRSIGERREESREVRMIWGVLRNDR